MKILNFGSLNIDFVYDVDHFVSKGETISSNARHVFSGGKGLNQSLAFSRAGGHLHHAGLIGKDGLFLKELLVESGVDVTWVRTCEGTPSGHAIIQRDASADNCILLHGGANMAVTKAFIDEVLAGFSKGDWLLLQNEISELAYCITAARARGLRIVLNPSPINEALLKADLDAIDCFILNEIEAASLSGCQGTPNQRLVATRQRFPRADIVLTLGEKGSMFAAGDEQIQQPAYDVRSVDTTAAGDTFAGYFLALRASGAPAATALDTAAKAAAIAVSRPGASPSIPRIEEVMAFGR
ncbi:Ribokinase [Pleomorphomonas sp. T1.2MG-36]|uniref:ribokinase n=1 Tax=Pleomorphomonas sp. T1.2MG-36 TaxID=3041167 RepID=UPI0024776682|nr:ribokinase [Pleomorphomonas sp. T1.2MG-36]CAI9409447.1 Ribokinase [Pleomorphomonas sp. T1.2MG-36]